MKIDFEKRLGLLQEENSKLQKQISVLRGDQGIHGQQLQGHSKRLRALQTGLTRISRELNGDDDEPYA